MRRESDRKIFQIAPERLRDGMLELCCAIMTESVRALWVKRENGKQISKLTGNIQIKWQNNVSVQGRAQGSSGSFLRFEGFD